MNNNKLKKVIEMEKVIHKRKNTKGITEQELKSAMNICKRLASNWFIRNNRYEYDEYLSVAYYGLSRSIKYYKPEKASFPTLTYTSATNEIKTMFLNDKVYNYKRGDAIEKYKLPVSIDVPISAMGKRNYKVEYKDLLPSTSYDETSILVKDYIHRVFDGFYNGFKTNNPKFRANKDRDIRVVSLICKGYTPMEVSNELNISNQLVNAIIKKFKNYAVQNDLVYKIS